MKNKVSKFFGFIIVCATLFGGVSGFFAARYSTQNIELAVFDMHLSALPVLAGEVAGGTNPLEDLKNAGSGFTGETGQASPPRDIRFIIMDLVRLFLGLIGTALLVVILYAGYLWWSAQGNEDNVKKAKATMRNAVIGMIIVTMSYAFVTFVFESFQKPAKPPDSLFDLPAML